MLWGWFAIGLVFLSLGESKLVTYALPLFPILALVIGGVLGACVRGSGRRRQTGLRVDRAGPAGRSRSAAMPAAGLLACSGNSDAVTPVLWMAVVAASVC